MELDAPVEYSDLEATEGAYHSVSALAVAALVLGLLSPLAFTHELLWGLPIAGVALACVAIARIDRSDGLLIGRKAALIGLTLSLVCGAGAVTQAGTRRLWLAHRANRVAKRFLELLREGKTYEAHQLWARPQFHFQPDPDYETVYSENPEAKKEYEGFIKREAIHYLLSLGENATVERERTNLTASEQQRDYLMVFYRIAGPTPAGPIEKEIKLVIERSINEDTGERWRVYSDEVVVE